MISLRQLVSLLAFLALLALPAASDAQESDQLTPQAATGVDDLTNQCSCFLVRVDRLCSSWLRSPWNFLGQTIKSVSHHLFQRYDWASLLKTQKIWIKWKSSIGVSDMRQFTTGDLNKQVGDVTCAASRWS